MKSFLFAALLVAALLPKTVCGQTIRLGHFPNITHAQALVASNLSRQGKGWFEERLGPGVKVEYYVYNAGPSAVEAIFARSIDLTYVGPNPVINAYSRSRGAEIRVIAGAANGGSALVVQGDTGLSKPADFRGKKIATPQLGNTQDVACRAWLKKNGFRITQLGGEVSVLPTANPDQLLLFRSKQVDAVWTVEPWVTRLELEAGARLFLEEKDALTTVLAASVKFQKEQPALLKKFAAAHAELTTWINEHPAEAKEMVRAELKVLTKADFPAEVSDRAWTRLKFTSEVSRAPFETLVKEAQSVGFAKGTPDLGNLVAIP
ncbi:MAG TPA: ABC transporter substrate-binding protein [Chthoniobacteraceae bacterium]|jgi:NitT/TauT family transport system substrate-binding protein|nr:aliphatic sulfonate transporter substrate-binding protein [Chthoniobacter sp.]HEV7867415.1 ABC transporter substrate-binding protein [Chthoniobacteraceae bacterium]